MSPILRGVIVKSRRNRHFWFWYNLVRATVQVGTQRRQWWQIAQQLCESMDTAAPPSVISKGWYMNAESHQWVETQRNSVCYNNVTYFVNNHGFHFFQISHGLISENGTKLWRKLLMKKNKNGRKPGQSMLSLLVSDLPTLFSSLLLYIWKLKFHQFRLTSTVTFFLELLTHLSKLTFFFFLLLLTKLIMSFFINVLLLIQDPIQVPYCT